MTKSNEEAPYTTEEALQAASKLIELATDVRLQTHIDMKDSFNNGVSQLIQRQPPVIQKHRMISSCTEEFDIIVSNLKMLHQTIKHGDTPDAVSVKSTKDKIAQVKSYCSVD
ncbi:MAG: hypothetical protein HOD92_10565 [Deltaproteobacteria bacterium]|jgi:hypothetical protein|nr:hypothetical protein [Deltaproteobacteria bacterium]MBT4527855.1 hypothetical protein [Deltaproteobacteria bacterium]